MPNEEDSGLDNERGYTSDSELSRVTVRQHSSLASRPTSPELSPSGGGGWILVSHSMLMLPVIFCLRMGTDFVTSVFEFLFEAQMMN